MSRLQTNNPEVWDEAYENGVSPWDAGAADEHLVRLVNSRQIDLGRVLDVGCGTGNETIFLSKSGFSAVGLDISREAITKAKEKARVANAGAEFLVEDILAPLPFTDDAFDVVIDRACFHFVPPHRVEIYLENLNRILRTGGRYILYVASERDIHIRGPVHYTKADVTQVFGTMFGIDDIRLVTLSQHALQPRPYLCQMTKLGSKDL